MPKPLKFALVAAVLLVLGISAQGTVASWRAESRVDPPTLTTGSLSLLAGGVEDYQFANLSAGDLIPGAFTQASLEISNAGTVPLSYELDGAVNSVASPTTADQALANVVQLSVYSGMNKATCDADQALTGEKLYTGPLGANASFATARELAARPGASNEILCLRVAVPEGATQTASGGKLSLQLRFSGQQR